MNHMPPFYQFHLQKDQEHGGDEKDDHVSPGHTHQFLQEGSQPAGLP